MVDYVATVGKTEAHSTVFDEKGIGYRIEAVESAPDHCALLDTVEDKLRESLSNGGRVNFKDLAASLITESKRALLAELLVKLLVILGDSKNVRCDIEILIAASGLPLRSVPDTKIAESLGLTRQAFSARKKALMKKLDLAPPPHSKSQKACANYALTNRKNAILTPV